MKRIHAATILTLLATQLPAQGPTPISVSFPGGSLTEFTNAVRKAGQDVNIVTSNLADEVMLPPLELKNAWVESALKAVARIVSAPYQVNVSTDTSPTGQPVHSVSVQKFQSVTTQGYSPPQPPERHVVVYSLRSLTDARMNVGDDPITMDSQTILTAIDAGLAVGGENDAGDATLRYHEDSGLLFVYGINTQTNLVRDVLDNLRSDLERARQARDHERARQRQRGPQQPSDPAEPAAPFEPAKRRR